MEGVAVKVVFDFSAQQVSIEGDGPQLLELLGKVREIVPKLSRIEICARQAGQTQAIGNGVSPEIAKTPNGVISSGVTLKQFVRQLNFQNMSERIAAIAYYFKRHENRDTFAPKEMDSWFTFATFQKPAQMGVALSDAARKHGFLESVGYGKWSLTTQGENLVAGKLNETAQE
jgi:hypothetical protein